ncbi:MAG: VOC family protein [Blastocatellia bacterium]
MSDQVKPIPEGYHTVTPYLILSDAAKAIDFYKQAFGAVELFRMDSPEGKIGHAELKIGDSPIMLADEHPQMGYRSVQTLGGSPISIMLYVEDSDAIYQQAIAAGATVKQEIKDQFYGDRSGTIADPFGYQWTISTHKEDVTPEEMEKRMAAMNCSATAESQSAAS